MELITKAVERARQEQSSTSGINEIVYAQTPTIEVSKEYLREKRVITGLKECEYTDPYKILRRRVQHVMREHGWTTLAISSCAPQNGKTLTAVNLSISLAMDVSQTVLLVDSDLRCPRVHTVFGFEPERGLSDYLLNGVSINELLVHPNIEHLVLLPGGKGVRNSSELLSSPRMLSLVRELKTRYISRLVLFDLPPVLSSDDMLAFAPHVDALLLVVEEGKTRTDEISRALELIKGTNLIGTVLNKSVESSRSYYYYY
jgi:ATPases involved in chromosome partitioning